MNASRRIVRRYPITLGWIMGITVSDLFLNVARALGWIR